MAGAESGAPPTDPALASVIEAWPTLTEPIRDAVLTLVSAIGR